MEIKNFQFGCTEYYLEVQCNQQLMVLKEDRNTINRDQILYLNLVLKENFYENVIISQLLKISFQELQQYDDGNQFVQLEIDYGDKQEKLQTAAQHIYQIYMVEPFIYVLSDRGIYIFNTSEMNLYHTLIFDIKFTMQIVNLRKEAFFLTVGSKEKVQMFTKFLYIYKNIQIIESQLNFKAFIFQASEENYDDDYDNENTSKITHQQLQFSISPIDNIQRYLEHDLNIESQIVEINSYENDDGIMIRIYLYIKIRSEITQTYALQYDIKFQSLLNLAKSQAGLQQSRFLKYEDIQEYTYKYIQTNQFLTSIPSNNQGEVYIYDYQNKQVLKFI